ncbi:peroxisomal membrane protein 11A-like [Andrographis paniculata]|uniref:peroxisomal membrane protein 11A-like n=1 Tax=Andrographis paniculata TaxID=175694 RepID=UPI0021E8FFA8|nr:peroxisomal membrane protein 11A-like [Andrographis paniculata]
MAANSPNPNPNPSTDDRKYPPPPSPAIKPVAKADGKDFLTHLEIYLAKRDGVDKLLKISRYATKVLLASSIVADHHPLLPRLKSFEASVGVSRKAFRLGKFVQDINALRGIDFASRSSSYLFLCAIAYGGEGLYYFVEQLVWLGKAGLIDKRRLPKLQLMSAWCEFVGYFGSVSLKVLELRKIGEIESSSSSSSEEDVKKLREKKKMKRLSVVQDFADALMALADIREGIAPPPAVISSAGLLSAVISTHKNWVSC